MISGNDINGTNDVHSTATGECNITGLKYTFTIILLQYLNCGIMITMKYYQGLLYY